MAIDSKPPFGLLQNGARLSALRVFSYWAEMEPSCSGQAQPVLALRPWWEKPRLQLCAERASSQLGCSYHTFVETQCREVKGSDGLPARKCTRTLKKFRDCGRWAC